MKYPNARIDKNNSGWYVLLNVNPTIYLTSKSEEFFWYKYCETNEIKDAEKQVYFDTKELAQQALNKYNNMRDYAALKQEGIDKNLCPGYVYLGEGNVENPLSNDWNKNDIYRIESKNIIDKTCWSGDSSGRGYCTSENIWNKKFPQEKKQITLNEIKSQYEEAKKLIGKNVSFENIVKCRKVDEVVLFVENSNKLSTLDENFLKENGYVISAKIGSHSIPYQQVELFKDVEVVLNSSYTATLSNSGIRVGCKTFPLEIIDKLVEARKQLN